MKVRIITLLLILAANYSFGQDDQSEYNKMFWDNTKYSKITEIPEKWKNESAVVIYKNENYKFHNFGKKVTYTSSFRKRIKLLDKSAVDDYSEFSYDKDFGMVTNKDYWNKNRVIGIKIIKSSGKEIIIDMEKASVKEDDKTKVAIPNLEVGDILDYYLFLEKIIYSKFQYPFTPEERTLSGEYPIMNYKLTLTSENDFFINFKSFNGAPELKKIATTEKKKRKYELIAENIAKSTGVRWTYPLVSNPAYKFQIYFARTGILQNRANVFLSDEESVIKESVSKKEVLDFYNSKYRTKSIGFTLHNYAKSKKYKNDAEKVTDVYYFMRYFYLNRYLEAIYISKAEILAYPFQYFGKNTKYMDNRKEFIIELTSFLKQEKINYEIVIAKSRYDGSIDDLLLESNVKPLILVKTDPPLYISLYNSHKTVNQILPSLEGTKAYTVSLSSFKKDEQVKTITLPTTTYKQNNNTQTAIVKIVDDFSGLDYEITNSYTGNLKEDQQLEQMYFADFIDGDYKKHDEKPFLERLKSKKKRATAKRKFDDLKTKIEKSLTDNFKESTSNGFGFTEDMENYKHKILEKGRYGFEQPFVVQETFSVKNDFIKRAGKNYIIEIGKLINQQVDIKEDERNRNQDIYMSYPRSYDNIIKFEIPEGYSVVGIKKLNKTVDNETGSFISTAKIEGNQLIIHTSKNYKHNYETNANWPKMLAFLDEAFQFNNEKILLKKK